MKNYDWVNDVLADMVKFAAENNLPITAGLLVSVSALVSRELAELKQAKTGNSFAPEVWARNPGTESGQLPGSPNP